MLSSRVKKCFAGSIFSYESIILTHFVADSVLTLFVVVPTLVFT